MDLSRLTAMQKRAHDWEDFIAQGGAQSRDLRVDTVATLTRYKHAIAYCWKNKEITANDVRTLEDLERKLEVLNERARLTVVPIISAGTHS